MPKCHQCGEVIGVYEPLVILVEGRPLETSRAREPQAGSLGERCYHRTCLQERSGEVWGEH
jgi:hypothetical protein